MLAEFTPHFAVLVTLLFLSGVFLTGLGTLAMVFAAVRRFSFFAGLAAVFTFLVAGSYLFLVIAVSAVSKDQVLPPGALKYFCELDCHLAYSVVDSYETAALGPELKQTIADGRFVVVGVKTWFDQKTISQRRGDGPVVPNRRRILLIDDLGKSFGISGEGARALWQSGISSTPLTQPLRPGESYITQLVFAVPSEARGLRLLVLGDDPESRLIIGHENSLFHKKIYLALGSHSHSSANLR